MPLIVVDLRQFPDPFRRVDSLVSRSDGTFANDELQLIALNQQGQMMPIFHYEYNTRP